MFPTFKLRQSSLIKSIMTMRALGVRTFGKADKLELLDVPVPTISNPDDILIQVKTISLNRSDGVKVLGYTRLFETVK